MTRIKLLLAGAFLVAMTITSTPAKAEHCVAGWTYTPTEQECADFCRDIAGCFNYIYDPVETKCFCS